MDRLQFLTPKFSIPITLPSLVFIIAMLSASLSYAQESDKNDTLRVDLDLDRKVDTVILDRAGGILICKLSTQYYKEIRSPELSAEGSNTHIRESGDGFTFSAPEMRSGYHMDFKYNRIVKRVQLVAMDRYEFGPASNDGSGESSVDLLTNVYQGDWNYLDMKRLKLIKMPTINRKMVFPKTYLDNLDDAIVYRYSEQCAAIYHEEKAKNIAARSKKKH